MRATLVLLVGAALYALSLGWAATRLTGTSSVPLHINAAGQVDRVGSPTEALTAMAVPGIVLTAIGIAILVLVRRAPLRLLNIPNREYWMREQNEAQVRRMLATDMATAISGTLAFTALIPAAITLAITHGPLPPVWAVIAAIGGFVALIIGWSIRMVTGPRYRPRPV